MRAPSTRMRLMVTPHTEAVIWKVIAVRPVRTSYSGQKSAVVQMCRYGWSGTSGVECNGFSLSIQCKFVGLGNVIFENTNTLVLYANQLSFC